MHHLRRLLPNGFQEQVAPIAPLLLFSSLLVILLLVRFWHSPSSSSSYKYVLLFSLVMGFGFVSKITFAPLLVIPSLLRELGVEPASVLERTGIERRALSDPTNRLPFSLAGRLLEECAAASACPVVRRGPSP